MARPLVHASPSGGDVAEGVAVVGVTVGGLEVMGWPLTVLLPDLASMINVKSWTAAGDTPLLAVIVNT